MKGAPYFPPLRGGIKGGVNRVFSFRSAHHLLQRFSPPSFPPRWGGRRRHEALAVFPSPQGRDQGWGAPAFRNPQHRSSSSTPPHPRSLPAGEGGAVTKGAPYLPPLRGGIKGGVHPVSAFRSVDHLHRRLSPPSFPPRWGGRRLHAAATDLPPLRGGIKGGVNRVCLFRSVAVAAVALFDIIDDELLERVGNVGATQGHRLLAVDEDRGGGLLSGAGEGDADIGVL